MNSPIDDIIIGINKHIQPHVQKLGIDITGFTIISSIFYLLAIYYLIKKNINYTALFIVLGYFTDVYYNTTLNISDNHKLVSIIKNILVIATIFYILYEQYEVKNEDVVLMIIGMFFVLMLSNYYKTNNKLLNLFGTGTFMFVLIMVLYYLDHKREVFEFNSMIDLSRQF
jgi:phosphatidylserine synthase